MRTPIALRNIIGKTERGFMKTIGPSKGEFNPNFFFFLICINGRM